MSKPRKTPPRGLNGAAADPEKGPSQPAPGTAPATNPPKARKRRPPFVL